MADTNKDRLISRTEWQTAVRTHNNTSHDFNHMDEDQDGHVSSHELYTYLSDHVGYGRLAAVLDRDEDDFIHENEYQQAEKSYVQLHLLHLDI